MRRSNNIRFPRLAGFTLSECLIVMIVGGLVFLGVTEGLGLFMRHTSSRTDRMQYEQQVFDDLMTLNGVLSQCDSVKVKTGEFRTFRDGTETVLTCPEDRIILRRGAFADTLLHRNRAVLEAIDNPEGKDGLPGIRITVDTDIDGTVEIEYFPRLTPAAHLAESIEETESMYGYEDE